MKCNPLYLSLLVLAVSCAHDEIQIYDDSGFDASPFYGIVSYDGPMADDTGCDIVDPGDADRYWEAVGFKDKVAVTWTDGDVSIQGLPSSVGRKIVGGHVTLAIGETKKLEIILRGSCRDGSLKVYGAKKFKLTLSGLDLSSSEGAAINIQCPKRVFVHLTEGTVNRISDAASYTKAEGEDMKGCLFAEGDILLSGTGVLIPEGRGGNALASDDGIFIRPGVTLSASSSAPAGKALKGKDYIDMRGGLLCLSTSGDAYFDEEVQDDKSAACISSDSTIFIGGGRITAVSTGIAGKGIKTDGNILIGEDGTTGPDIAVQTCGGFLEGENYSSSPKGIKAGGRIEVRSGRISIPGCMSEAMECKDRGEASFFVGNGELEIKSSDDCINSAGGLRFEGGRVFALSTDNDAIDSNFRGQGAFVMSGGLVIAVTSSEKHECGIDVDKAPMVVSGGTIFTCGRTQRGSTSTPSVNTATQPTVLLADVSWSDGDYIAAYDTSGKALFSFCTPFPFSGSYTLLTHPGFLPGQTYYVRKGGNEPASGQAWNGWWDGSDAACETLLKTVEFTKNYVRF